MTHFLNKYNPFAKSLDSLRKAFQKHVDELRKLAAKKAEEAARKEAQAIVLMAEVEACEAEAEEALNDADKISQPINGKAPQA